MSQVPESHELMVATVAGCDVSSNNVYEPVSKCGLAG